MCPAELKDPELLGLITRLATDLGQGSIEVVDDWPEDLVAIGVRRRGDSSRLVYVELRAAIERHLEIQGG
jgi:hypothetical protein